MRRRVIAATMFAAALGLSTAGAALAAPDNGFYPPAN